MWKTIIEREQQKPYYKSIQTFLEQEYQTHTVFPPYEDILRAFELCTFQDVKVVILGQDPYHNVNQAHGLAFSVKTGEKIPPSLRNIYKELHTDLQLPIPKDGDLSAWARQGVLLLNTILTVRAHEPLSHQHIGWQIFTDCIISELNKDDQPKVFVLWGNNALKKSMLVTNPNHLIISSSHPSPLSARHSFFGSRVFSRINTFLVQKNREPINFNID